jgi:hypothetical protein
MLLKYLLTTSVVDPDPGSLMAKKERSGSGMNIPDISESFEKFLGL